MGHLKGPTPTPSSLAAHPVDVPPGVSHHAHRRPQLHARGSGRAETKRAPVVLSLEPWIPKDHGTLQVPWGVGGCPNFERSSWPMDHPLPQKAVPQKKTPPKTNGLFVFRVHLRSASYGWKHIPLAHTPWLHWGRGGCTSASLLGQLDLRGMQKGYARTIDVASLRI